MITDADKDFLRALVALVRAHRMNHISITYDNASLKNDIAKVPRGDRVTATWAEGRSGLEASIGVETRTNETIPEKLEDEPLQP